MGRKGQGSVYERSIRLKNGIEIGQVGEVISFSLSVQVLGGVYVLKLIEAWGGGERMCLSHSETGDKGENIKTGEAIIKIQGSKVRLSLAQRRLQSRVFIFFLLSAAGGFPAL